MRFKKMGPLAALALAAPVFGMATAAHATGELPVHLPKVNAPKLSMLPTSFSFDTDPQAFLPSGDVGTSVLRWNPCQPLHWAINPAGAPKGFAKEARKAATEMAHASGLVMDYEGLTSIRPTQTSGRLDDGPLRDAGLQLVVAWDTHSDAGSLLGPNPTEAGATLRQAAGSETQNGNDVAVTPTQYDEAAISFDIAQRSYLVKHDNRGDGLYRALLHELGHVAGLNHVSDPQEVMSAVGTPASSIHYTAGDLAGLKNVGFDRGCM